MHRALIAMGANLPSFAGAPEATLSAAVLRFQPLGSIVAKSSLYSTEPVGLRAQPRFLNAVLALDTELSPQDLLGKLLTIEQEFGRDRSSGLANGPRTLDLDILLYDALVLDEANLQIPHPRLAERAFVLVPLTEIASETLDPQSGKTVAELLHALRQHGETSSNDVQRVNSASFGSPASTSSQ